MVAYRGISGHRLSIEVKKRRLYPGSKVELTPFIAKHYDQLLDLISFGSYSPFISRAIADVEIQTADSILDLGCGTGRNASLMLRHLGPVGKILGLDLSPIMQQRFEETFRDHQRVSFRRQRIDVPFELGEKFDLVFMSFVLHGFPQQVRKIILENIIHHLKPRGRLAILDYAEFNLNDTSFVFRWVFRKFECSYALDFIKYDWKKILGESGFKFEYERFYFRNLLRLLKIKLI